MTISTICPCGIHRDDCDYHKPVPESEPVTLRTAPASGINTQTFINALAIMGDSMDDSEPTTVRFGTYSSSITINNYFSDGGLSKIAEQTSSRWVQRMNEIIDDWAKTYFS